MPTRFLLDTNICIYAVSGRYPHVTARVDALRPGEAVMSVIVLGELAYGVAKSSRAGDARRRLDALRTLIAVAPLPPEAGSHYGDIRASLEARGTPIGANDYWIAAHARAAGLTLVTNNAREFRRVKGLKVENWA